MTVAPSVTGTAIVGLDLSLTATGICDRDGARVISSRQRGMTRLDDIVRLVEAHLERSYTVIVEGYSYASKNQAHQLGELGGVVRWRLWTLGVEYVDVPPSALKKFATGKGNAGKPDMLAAAIRAGYDGPNDDNCVDAQWLRWMGMYAHATPSEAPVPVTQYRDEAVAKIDWPEATS